MKLTSYQAKYLAYELTRRFPSGDAERFNIALMDAQVDLNGEFADIDHLITAQIDHRFRGKLTT